MFLLDGTVVTSASDLTAASKCEFAFLRSLDAKLGRIERLPRTADAMLERTARLGDEHEARTLDDYRRRFGAGVIEIARPETSAAAIGEAVAATRRAFEAAADVVFQATFFDPSPEGDDLAFIGFADFIVRETDGAYRVEDTKLARHARVTALLQVAAYAEALDGIGVPVAENVRLLLGDNTTTEHRLVDISPVFRSRRQRLNRLIHERLAASGPIEWGAPGITVCGRCDACAAEVETHRDVLLVAGMRLTQRARLIDAGVDSIDALAHREAAIDGVSEAALAGLRSQARLQLAATPGDPPPVEVFNAHALRVLPQPDAGDVFFDFEGDPLYTEGAPVPGKRTAWGLDYLFGVYQTDGTYLPFWAHDFAAERVALIEFLRYIAERRRRHPRMHIYHYASYERTHLLTLAARHGVGEDEVDDLLRDHVLVDLYPLVRASVRVGSHSYSIKKLEPLYMGSELRESDVTNGADSITAYVAARDVAATAAGDPVRAAEADAMLDELADYNRYDCLSTLRLRDWLLVRAADHGVGIGVSAPEPEVIDVAPSSLRDALLERAGQRPGAHEFGADATVRRDDDQTAAAFAAAALDYHRREQKSFWWGHFARLEGTVEEWADTRDVMVVERAVVERDWHRDEGQRVERRHLRLWGDLGPGSNLKTSTSPGPFLLYDEANAPVPPTRPGSRVATRVAVLEVADDGSLLVCETERESRHDTLPMALTPAAPPPAGLQASAIEQWAAGILAAAPGWPADPMTDLLRRVPPRVRGGAPAVQQRVESGDAETLVDRVTCTVRDLDGSYLAVQGPPGTGKTYLGAHVIARLVRENGWKVGVVGQSHKVVDNLLRAVIAAGLPPEAVGKARQSGAEPADEPYTVIPSGGHAAFTAGRGDDGFVIGGTAWDFSNPARVPRRSLDLLVVDEAGQFSLAATIAAAAGTRNLLLLGDPQQLPQVSQGVHPEPVDQSALGWVSAGHDVLPAEFGFFLPQTRRMHPRLAAAVSALSYEGRLDAHPQAETRSLDGVPAGLTPVPVEHHDNATESPEEADTVVALVADLLGRRWSDPPSGQERPLRQTDVIVVTPYNAQLALINRRLEAAGYGEVPVGTVDKFQGQEAAVAIVSLAASSPADVPRGMGFLIMKNRLNVAVSRAQYAAYLVHSPALSDYLPFTPDGVAELSAFMRLRGEA